MTEEESLSLCAGSVIENAITGHVFDVVRRVDESRDPPEYVLVSRISGRTSLVFWTWLAHDEWAVVG